MRVIEVWRSGVILRWPKICFLLFCCFSILLCGSLPHGPCWLLRHLLSCCNPDRRKKEGHIPLTLKSHMWHLLLRSSHDTWLWRHRAGWREAGRWSYSKGMMVVFLAIWKRGRELLLVSLPQKSGMKMTEGLPPSGLALGYLGSRLLRTGILDLGGEAGVDPKLLNTAFGVSEGNLKSHVFRKKKKSKDDNTITFVFLQVLLHTASLWRTPPWGRPSLMHLSSKPGVASRNSSFHLEVWAPYRDVVTTGEVSKLMWEPTVLCTLGEFCLSQGVNVDRGKNGIDLAAFLSYVPSL